MHEKRMKVVDIDYGSICYVFTRDSRFKWANERTRDVSLSFA
jgi:hypothetical protein